MLRRNKKTITGKNVGPHGSNIKSIKPQLTRKIIRRYHFLLQREKFISQIIELNGTQISTNTHYKNGWKQRGADMNVKDEAIESELIKLRNSDKSDPKRLLYLLGYISCELQNKEGLANYQIASRMGQDSNRGGDSSKILIKWLKEINIGDMEGLKALEIGSLSKYNKISTSGIFQEVVRIDLNNSNDEDGIIKQDFMKRRIPDRSDTENRFHLISCSLVLNFVPTPHERGDMCKRFSQFLKDDGFLFIVLPLPCLNNSRYMNLDHFSSMMQALQYKIVKSHTSSKLIYILLRQDSSLSLKAKQGSFPKKKLQDKPGMNNFSIVI